MILNKLFIVNINELHFKSSQRHETLRQLLNHKTHLAITGKNYSNLEFGFWRYVCQDSFFQIKNHLCILLFVRRNKNLVAFSASGNDH